mmetsp:Transcript_2333/g.7092  ORF Transcript_2333/g.7092 Transcript_2333/m.7092 type:complete len:118 (+) Transcript_2333:167-520(+)
MSFSWWKLVDKVESTNGTPDQVGSLHALKYKDGQSISINIRELSDIEHFVTWEVVSSDEALPVSSTIHTIRVRRITASNETFVEWSTDFSSDASAEVIQDSKFKKLEAFKDMEAAMK